MPDQIDTLLAEFERYGSAVLARQSRLARYLKLMNNGVLNVAEYMKRRDEQAAALRAEIDARQPRVSREELLARRAAREQADAALATNADMHENVRVIDDVQTNLS